MIMFIFQYTMNYVLYCLDMDNSQIIIPRVYNKLNIILDIQLTKQINDFFFFRKYIDYLSTIINHIFFQIIQQ